MIDHTKALLHLAKNLRHSLTEEQLGAILAPVPTIEEQQRIVDFLDFKCSKIDATAEDIQKEITLLEDYKKSLVYNVISNGINHSIYSTESDEVWGNLPQGWKLVDIKYFKSFMIINSLVYFNKKLSLAEFLRFHQTLL